MKMTLLWNSLQVTNKFPEKEYQELYTLISKLDRKNILKVCYKGFCSIFPLYEEYYSFLKEFHGLYDQRIIASYYGLFKTYFKNMEEMDFSKSKYSPFMRETVHIDFNNQFPILCKLKILFKRLLKDDSSSNRIAIRDCENIPWVLPNEERGPINKSLNYALGIALESFRVISHDSLEINIRGSANVVLNSARLSINFEETLKSFQSYILKLI